LKSLIKNSKTVADIVATEDASTTRDITNGTEDATEDATEFILKIRLIFLNWATENSFLRNLSKKVKLLKMKKKSKNKNIKTTGDTVATEDANITDIVIDITEDAIENAIEDILTMVKLTSKS